MFSMTPIQKFWFSKLESGVLANSGAGWDTDIPTKSLHGDFVRFCNDIGVRHKLADSEFGTLLRKLAPGISNGKGKASKYGSHRPNVYKVPSLAECREVFCKFINYQVEWPVYEDNPSVAPPSTVPPASDVSEQE